MLYVHGVHHKNVYKSGEIGFREMRLALGGTQSGRQANGEALTHNRFAYFLLQFPCAHFNTDIININKTNEIISKWHSLYRIQQKYMRIDHIASRLYI